MIQLPRDAEGREIPLDTEVLYDMCGTKVSVKEFLFRTLVESQRTQWTIKAAYEGNFYYNSFKPENMHLTQPDSWERTYSESVPMTARGSVGTQTRTRSRTYVPIAANFSRATKSLAVRS